MENDIALLDVELCVDYPNRPRALKDVRFQMRAGEVLGLVGESGSGKSTIALALLGLLQYKGAVARGYIRFGGCNLLLASEREMRQIRGRDIGLVMQSPMASLNPAVRIGKQLSEAWKAHAGGSRKDVAAAVTRALTRAGLPHDEEFRRRYPAQISVGQAQRVLIAIAVMHSPRLLIADEPTSALDVLTQAQALQMLAAMNRNLGSALLYISHDLSSVASICQRVAILRAGEIVECGPVHAVLQRPRHPYTQSLVSCAPWLTQMLPSSADTSESLPVPEVEPWAGELSSHGHLATRLKSSSPQPIVQ